MTKFWLAETRSWLRAIFCGATLRARASPHWRRYGIHTLYMVISMSYRHCNVETRGHRGELVPTGAHGFGPWRFVIAIPAAKPGDDPGQPGQRPRRVWVLLALRLAFQSRPDRCRRLENRRLGNIAARSRAAIAGIDQLDGAHRGADR